ncbi:hypothetical protein TNCV_3502801 [Trichonephila clavipes]|uniref:Uncharacterized protein n=1 Tax=Trichonephila clavipes TaxID=2585209 RepID=A0A8X6RWH7_TRICX|nr:hypothetical protein TNCV_3502801 [Trichonephila clavipes]
MREIHSDVMKGRGFTEASLGEKGRYNKEGRHWGTEKEIDEASKSESYRIDNFLPSNVVEGSDYELIQST